MLSEDFLRRAREIVKAWQEAEFHGEVVLEGEYVSLTDAIASALSELQAKVEQFRILNKTLVEAADKDGRYIAILTDERDALALALQKYGEHHTICFPGGTKGNPCTCGFDDALSPANLQHALKRREAMERVVEAAHEMAHYGTASTNLSVALVQLDIALDQIEKEGGA